MSAPSEAMRRLATFLKREFPHALAPGRSTEETIMLLFLRAKSLDDLRPYMVEAVADASRLRQLYRVGRIKRAWRAFWKPKMDLPLTGTELNVPKLAEETDA